MGPERAAPVKPHHEGPAPRYFPLSQELRAMLELRRYDPDGEDLEPDT